MKQQLITILLAVLLFSSCKKDVVSRTENIAALNPASLDINAGLWKPILLTGSTEFAVAAPGATNLPGYTAEVNEIKSWQQNMSNEQKDTHGGNMSGFVVGRSDGGDRRFYSVARGGP